MSRALENFNFHVRTLTYSIKPGHSSIYLIGNELKKKSQKWAESLITYSIPKAYTQNINEIKFNHKLKREVDILPCSSSIQLILYLSSQLAKNFIL